MRPEQDQPTTRQRDPDTPSDLDTVALATEEAWLEARSRGIGASEAASILGVNPWEAPIAVYARKVGEQPDSPETEPMRWGKILESVIANHYAQETGRQVEDPGPYTLTWSSDVPWMFCTLDRLVVDETKGLGDLELKTAGSHMKQEWKDEVPLPYQIQVQHQLACTGHEWGSIAVLIGGQHFLWTDLERNDSFIEKMIVRLGEFWQRVQNHDPPPPDASESSRNALAALYPKDTGRTIELPSWIVPWHEMRERAQKIIKVEKERLVEADNSIKAAIGDATFGILPDGTRYSWKHQTRKETIQKASEFRVLRTVKS